MKNFTGIIRKGSEAYETPSCHRGPAQRGQVHVI